MNRNHCKVWGCTKVFCIAVSVFLFVSEAYAGMPSISIILSDVVSLRLKALSFFGLVFVTTTFALWKLWNFLRKDFPVLPPLSFKSAVAMVFLWGLAFHLVLVMIAGARELMTPGAWVKDDKAYVLQQQTDKHELPKRTYK
ncbi:MAG: hypothetical protein HQL61_10275 [Magnetococcales bacterium]|nr:hypothetical protein [Nitrospirota bacterium]